MIVFMGTSGLGGANCASGVGEDPGRQPTLTGEGRPSATSAPILPGSACMISQHERSCAPRAGNVSAPDEDHDDDDDEDHEAALERAGPDRLRTPRPRAAPR